jgi:hypothetical protein
LLNSGPGFHRLVMFATEINAPKIKSVTIENAATGFILIFLGINKNKKITDPNNNVMIKIKLMDTPAALQFA